MALLRKVGLGAAAAAMTVTAISPAMAEHGGGYGYGYGGYNGYGGHHGGHHDNDTGEVLGGILIGAILVGVLASASKKSKQARRDSGQDYPVRNSSNDNRSGSIASEDQAVDACATAAEQKAGRSSSVRDIRNVRRSDDGWDVEGVVESRNTWRDKSASNHNFTCSVRYGAVDTVYVEDGKVAYNDREFSTQN